MDPLTIAARAFIDDASLVWRAGRSRVLRAVSASDDRGELVKALRMMELAPANRRPFFVYEAPFDGEERWHDGLCSALREGYEAVRKGAESEGVTLPALADDDVRTGAAARAAAWVRRVASALRGPLDGAVVVLIPSEIRAREAWRATMRTWATAPIPEEVRLAVWDSPDGALEAVIPAEATARFSVDRDAIFAHAIKQNERRSAGPEVPLPSVVTAAKGDRGGGSATPSPEGGRRLRGALLEAARAMARQDWYAAAGGYRVALMICRDEGLRVEEVTVLVALGGLCAAVGDVPRAHEAYAAAAHGATEIELWPVVMQAWLGTAGLYMLANDARSSAFAYEHAAEAARVAGNTISRIEALRVAGECHASLGDDASAVRCWNAAVEDGIAAEAAMREASTMTSAAARLVTTLERHGMQAQAARVRAQVATARKEAPRA